jgi:beta-phosphoglucomutase-like phosphatase (HAD superfamily)
MILRTEGDTFRRELNQLPIRALLFDWDGTIANKAFKWAKSSRAVLASFGVPVSKREFREYQSRGSVYKHWIEKFGLQITEDELRNAVEDHYQKQTGGIVHPTMGAIAALSRFPNIPKAIVTSSPSAVVASDARVLGVSERLAVIIGKYESIQGKPSPVPVVQAAWELGVDPSEIALVGDSIQDMRSAQEAGARGIFLYYGLPFKERSEVPASLQIRNLKYLTTRRLSTIGRLVG